MFYHIKFMYSIDSGECSINLSEDDLLNRYVNPYLNGDDIMINGSRFDLDRLWKIQIVESDTTIDNLIKQLEYINSQIKGMRSVFAGSPKWKAFDKLKDVTNSYINRPPKKDSIEIAVKVINVDSYVNLSRLEELKNVKKINFDISKLIRLCEEINSNWSNGNYFSVIALVRTLMHHIPPIFSLQNFEQLANNYNGGASFKKAMLNLFNSSKHIADTHLHSQINKKEVLPNNTQVDYRNDIDFLLCEIIKTLN